MESAEEDLLLLCVQKVHPAITNKDAGCVKAACPGKWRAHREIGGDVEELVEAASHISAVGGGCCSEEFCPVATLPIGVPFAHDHAQDGKHLPLARCEDHWRGLAGIIGICKVLAPKLHQFCKQGTHMPDVLRFCFAIFTAKIHHFCKTGEPMSHIVALSWRTSWEMHAHCHRPFHIDLLTIST